MSTQTENKSKWNTVKSFPSADVGQPFVVNNDEFIVASSNISHCNGDGIIYKFNIQKKQWIKIFDYDTHFHCIVYSAAYDNKHKLLQICDINTHPAKMVTFNLKTKNKVTKKEQDEGYFGLIFVEHKLHQICSRNGDHYIYDTTKQFQKLTTCNSLKDLFNYNFIYLKSQKTVLLFGGVSWPDWKNSIYGFSFIDSKWKELNIKMPIKLSYFGLVSTKNEKYIIILGGMTNISFSSQIDDIFIYDIRN
eukprot:397419_1